ncbi:hypothetical protein [Rhodopirellula baltica]|uniref:Uncharacterized protein n=1 Tax=Rhodopirellula baltica SWK14 TaxID=993516 RepID=L7CNA3_RHOBT|nr:hypothetical protein [Rhodopirellula baltica]ELP35335.1 hypothetical protein RBSWK_00735 [Rhodopirellula baltica SWK14]
MLSWLLSLCGCGSAGSNPARLDPNASVVTETPVVGFDTDAEPVIRAMSDGSVWIHFEAIPPFFADDLDAPFDTDRFLADLSDAAGATVVQDDREVFVVAQPTDQTTNSIKTFLESYPKDNGG